MKRKAVLFSSLILTVMMVVAFLGYQLGKGTGFTGNFEDQACYPGVPSTASYIVDTNNTHYACYEGFTGSVMSVTTDDQILIQGRITQLNLVGGGIIFLKRGTYSCSLTVKANVLLLMEPGVTGVTYTVDSGGYCMRYSGGYAYFEHPLNMTGNQLLFGAFHTGSSAPSAISTGQWWYDTSSYTLKVYNGTGWEQVQGGTGPAGPAGKVEGLAFAYMVFHNATSNYMLNGATGEIEDSDADPGVLINFAVGNLTENGGVIFLKGDIITTTQVVIHNKANITLTSGKLVYNDECLPYIEQIKISSTYHQGTRGIILSGISTREIHFDADGVDPTNSSIENVVVENCAIYKTSTLHGIILEGDSPMTDYMNMIRFRNCKIATAGGDRTTWGAVTYVNAMRVTEIYFVRCNFATYTSDNSFFNCDGESQPDSLYLTDCRFYCSSAGTSLDIFYQRAKTTTHPVGWSVRIISGRIEGHAAIDLFYFETSTANYRFYAQIIGFTAATDSGAITGFHNDNTMWITGCSIVMVGNRLSSNFVFHSGTGSFTTESEWRIDCSDNGFWRTENWGTASGASTPITVDHGLAETPASIVVTATGGDWGDIYVDSIGASQFNINYDGGGAGDETFTWHAKWVYFP